jgi:hypothetical protein
MIKTLKLKQQKLREKEKGKTQLLHNKKKLQPLPLAHLYQKQQVVVSRTESFSP